MAGGPAITSTAPKSFEGKVTSYVLLASIVAASGGLLFGYDIGITGGVTSMDDFLEKFFPDIPHKQSEVHTSAWCKFDSQLLQLFTSSLFLAGMLGGFLGAATTSRFGRVRTMLLAGIFFIIGAALTGLASGIAMLVIGRMMLGLGVGCANQTVPLYLSEMAPARWRGALNMMFQQATTIGIVVAQFINYGTQNIHPWGWRISLGLAAVPAILLTLGGVFLPETPNNLIERGNDLQGEAALKKIRGVENVEEELMDIKAARDRALQLRRPFSTIFQRRYRPQLFWAIAIPVFQQLTGINSIMFYVAPLFNTLGFGSGAALYSAGITGAVNVAATLVGIFAVDRWGRRGLFLEGGAQMVIMQVLTAVILKSGFGDGSHPISQPAAVGVVVTICCYVAGFAWSWGPLGWLVPSEIQPLETRSAGQAITVAFNFLFTFGVGQAFLSMLCHFQFGIFLFFAGWVVIMTLVVYFLLPETKGVPLEDMGSIWLQNKFWRAVLGEDIVAEMETKTIVEV